MSFVEDAAEVIGSYVEAGDLLRPSWSSRCSRTRSAAAASTVAARAWRTCSDSAVQCDRQRCADQVEGGDGRSRATWSRRGGAAGAASRPATAVVQVDGGERTGRRGAGLGQTGAVRQPVQGDPGQLERLAGAVEGVGELVGLLQLSGHVPGGSGRVGASAVEGAVDEALQLEPCGVEHDGDQERGAERHAAAHLVGDDPRERGDDTSMSMRARERLIHQYLRERFGSDVAVPCYDTLRAVWSEWFGPGGARRRYVRSAAAVETSIAHVVVTALVRSSQRHASPGRVLSAQMNSPRN